MLSFIVFLQKAENNYGILFFVIVVFSLSAARLHCSSLVAKYFHGFPRIRAS